MPHLLQSSPATSTSVPVSTAKTCVSPPPLHQLRFRPHATAPTLCNEHISIFQQTYHLASNPHVTALRQHTARHIPTTIPTIARSSSFEVRNTFSCLTCGAEFIGGEQDLHLATTETCVCELCSSRMQPAAREPHVDSEMHACVQGTRVGGRVL